MTSNSLAQCCTVGVKHEGTATGEMIEIDGSTSSYTTTTFKYFEFQRRDN